MAFPRMKCSKCSETRLPTQANRQRYRKVIKHRRIDVVFELDPTQVVVITVIA